jgi:hypothetical protein
MGIIDDYNTVEVRAARLAAQRERRLRAAVAVYLDEQSRLSTRPAQPPAETVAPLPVLDYEATPRTINELEDYAMSRIRQIVHQVIDAYLFGIRHPRR